VEALAKAMLLLTCDRPLRQTMGQVARSIAEQHSWQQMAQQYVDLLEELQTE
jgi:glycosyltransferase involved in cell wall biosynthesis